MSTAPKVTPDQLEEAIIEETYTVLPDGRTTVCQLTLDNGFTVEGFSACVSKENFNAELGNKYSRERAVSKVWEHLGFRLADQLAVLRASDAPQLAHPEGATYIGTKAIYARPMTRGAYNEVRGWTVPADENPADEGFLVEYLDAGQQPHHVSWSPKSVFERAYKRIDGDTSKTFLDRLELEFAETKERVRKLAAFLDTTPFYSLDHAEQDDLRLQHRCMVDYVDCMSRRITRIKKKN